MSSKIWVKKSNALTGTCRVPGDKSISHRAVMLASIADGTSTINGFLSGADCLATIEVMRSMGVKIEQLDSTVVVHGVGLQGLRPSPLLYCDNSGTTMRLMAGLMVGQSFDSRLEGTPQLSGRPMNRIIEPLKKMNARIDSQGGFAPLIISGQAKLNGIEYTIPMASAQVKSCALLAGIYANKTTTVIEPGPTRDHTERMLQAMGAKVNVNGPRISVEPVKGGLRAIDMEVPGDISSAAFIITSASIVPGSEITIENVGINPTRIGIVEALRKMGAKIIFNNQRLVGAEPVADIYVKYSPLHGASFAGDEIVTMIDELPVLAVAASVAGGTTSIVDAKELRVKETDRIAGTASELGKLGAKITTADDGMKICGEAVFSASNVSSLGDHRLAMLLTVAGLIANGETLISQAEVTADSFPGFTQCLASIGALVKEE